MFGLRNGGGGIYSSGTLTVTDSTIDNNLANTGGGIYINNGTLTVTNSTIADNSASGEYSRNFDVGDGGGIWNYDGTLTVTNSTIAYNRAYDGGGIYNFSPVTLDNTIVAANSPTAPNEPTTYDITGHRVLGRRVQPDRHWRLRRPD